MSDRTIIVIRPNASSPSNLRQLAENAAIAADPSGGAGAFIPGHALRAAGDATNTPVAWSADWLMLPGQRSAFAQSLGGPINTLAKGANVDLTRDRFMFDAADGTGWTMGEVLAALSLAQISYPMPGTSG